MFKPLLFLCLLVACSQNHVGHAVVNSGIWADEEVIYRSIRKSQFAALEYVAGDSLKSEYSVFLEWKWDGVDTTYLHLLVKEIYRMHNDQQCSDSLLLIKSYGYGEADATYCIVDLDKKIDFIVAITDSIAQISSRTNYNISPADTILKSYFIDPRTYCTSKSARPIDIFFIHGSNVESCLCLGQNDKDYDWLLPLLIGI